MIMQMSMKDVAAQMKMASPKLAITTCEQRNNALLKVKEACLRGIKEDEENISSRW